VDYSVTVRIKKIIKKH